MIVVGVWDKFAKLSCFPDIGPIGPMGPRGGVLPGAMGGITGVSRTWRGVLTLRSGLDRHPNESTELIYLAEDVNMVLVSSGS